MPVPRSLTTAGHQDFEMEVVAGEWPSDLTGDVLYSSPQTSHQLPYEIFDWGAICRLSLDPGARGAAPGRFAWQAVSIETPGKRLYNRHPEQFTSGPIGYESPFGTPNCSNTAPLPWGDRLYTTWDAGRPVELHPDTLEFVAEVGHIDTWGGNSMPTEGVLPMLISSAHPVADPERHCLWTVKAAPVMEPTFGMQPSIVRYDRHDGTQVKHWPLDGIAFSGALHTVSQTRDWIIMCDSGNFKVDPVEMFGGERSATIDDEVPVWLIRKDALEGLPSGTPVKPVCFTMSPPNGHYYARWDDSDGISVVWEGMDLMDLAMYMRPDDLDVNGNPVDPGAVGLYNMAMAPETIVEVQFDPESGKVLEQGLFKQDWTWNLQLSAMDWSVEGMSKPTLHHVTYQGCRPGNISQRAAKLYEGRIDLDQVREETPGALCSFDRGSMELKAKWEYANTSDHITSPAFAPRDLGADANASSYAGGEPGGHDGYVIQPICSDDGFRVDLFDAARVGDGPIATLKSVNNECAPLILHAGWMPARTELVDAERLRFSDELDDARMSSVPEELRASIREVAEECDALF
ncbi:MAG TPA: carotenoid oxygenase family protein [Acidimicrobiales bacterium]|nr:carotenoid oxygenase family protein [Acidimicrobiales bacterium]